MLAKKLNINNFYTKPDDELLEEMFDKSFLKDIVSYKEFKIKGLLRLEEEPFIAFKEQIADPDNNPFPTPSGKIEIYSQGLDEIDFDGEKYSGVIPDFRNIPRIPTFIQCDELPGTARARKYPLQLTTPHSLFRTHSQYDNIPRLRKLYRHEAWINTEDAQKRGIADGDRIRVFNDRGAILVYAKVTDRVTKGVTRCYEGTWYDPVYSDSNTGTEKMIDRGGCVNVLIDDMLTSPGGASNCNTCLVEVEIYKGQENKVEEVFE
jgi:anaerobic dimethyl sulfoxide reductase subunit A